MQTLTINGEKKGVRYQHHRKKNSKGISSYGGVTFCTVNLGTKEVPDIKIARAQCHSKELFKKSMGCAISRGRLVHELKVSGFEVLE